MEPTRLGGKSAEPRIKWASVLIAGGLLIQLLSLLPMHPLAFVAFLILGCPLMAAGVVVYLISLISDGQ